MLYAIRARYLDGRGTARQWAKDIEADNLQAASTRGRALFARNCKGAERQLEFRVEPAEATG